MGLKRPRSRNRITPIFLFGCPRSGTTVLQSLLAAHPLITSFPESHFFAALSRPAPLGRIGIAPVAAKRVLLAYLREIGRPEMARMFSRLSITRRHYATAFVKIMDAITESREKKMWVEKTPRHLHHIDMIERLLPGALFIHILRNGPDVVASLYQVTREYPDDWGGPRSIDQCIDRWLMDVNISLGYRGQPRHLLVHYDRLVESVSLVLEDICGFLGVAFCERMVQDHRTASEDLILDRWEWIRGASESIRPTAGVKFERVFDEVQKKHIIDRTAFCDISEVIG